MSVYRGDYAKLYDLFHAEKPYDNEAIFVDRLLREHGYGSSERLLDVACGTGQHAIRLAALGWDVTGVDQSSHMLARAAERGENSSVRFVEQDMRRLDLPARDFDAAVCLFDSIGYGITNKAIAATLLGIRRHLRPGGLFLAEFWHAAPMLTHHEPLRIRELPTEDGLVVRVSKTTLDVARQVARVEYSVSQLRSDSTYHRSSEVHENRFFLVQEMGLFLADAGFEPLRWFNGLTDVSEIDGSTWHVVVLARTTNGEGR